MRYWVPPFLLMIVVGVLSTPAWAATDPNADIVSVRGNCIGAANCFETMAAATDWISATRKPSAASPLLVNIGPSEFGQLACGGPNIAAPQSGFGHVTFRGAGRDRTTIRVDDCGSGAAGTTLCGAIQAVSSDCDKLEFQNLTAKAEGDPRFGIVWVGIAGDSTWTNVDVIGQRIGWYEFTAQGGLCQPSPLSVHYWFNSRISAAKPDGFGGIGYDGNCGESWFYGSDISVALDPNTPNGSWTDGLGALTVGRIKGDVRVFGTTIRVLGASVSDAVNPDSGIVGVRVFQNGVFHMHSGIINTTVSATSPSEVVGLKIENGGFAHTPGTAFVVRGGQGPARIQGGGAQAPFLWPPGTSTPKADPTNVLSAELGSRPGADLFVETDCNAAGNCAGGGSDPHLMIYNDSDCSPSNPWFDVVTGKCRAVGCF